MKKLYKIIVFLVFCSSSLAHACGGELPVGSYSDNFHQFLIVNLRIPDYNVNQGLFYSIYRIENGTKIEVERHKINSTYTQIYHLLAENNLETSPIQLNDVYGIIIYGVKYKNGINISIPVEFNINSNACIDANFGSPDTIYSSQLNATISAKSTPAVVLNYDNLIVSADPARNVFCDQVSCKERGGPRHQSNSVGYAWDVTLSSDSKGKLIDPKLPPQNISPPNITWSN